MFQDLILAARMYVDAHIGDCLTQEMLDQDNINGKFEFYNIVSDLAYAGAIEAGASADEARLIASEVQGEY